MPTTKPKSQFLKAVTVLTGGAVAGQIVTLAALPIVTRLYTPENFETLAVFVAVVTIGSVAANLRLDIAIPLPKRRQDAVNLLALSLISCTAISAAMVLILLVFGSAITETSEMAASLGVYKWMVPLSVWLIGVYSSFLYWATRKKEFSTIAKTRLFQSFGSAGIQVILGLAGLTNIGLLLGYLTNSATGTTSLILRASKASELSIKAVSKSRMLKMLREYERFPKYSTFEALANSAATQIPILLISSYALGSEAGHLLLAMRVMAGPMGILGAAVAQVYLSGAPNELRAGTLTTFTTNVLVGLVKAGVGPLIFIGLLAPLAFPIVFGENWTEAGHIVQWMTPWFIAQLLSSPIATAMHIKGAQKTALHLQIFGFALRIGSTIFASIFSASYVMEAYIASSFVFYCIYIIVVLKTVQVPSRELFESLKSAAPIVICWVIAAMIGVCILPVV